MGVSRTASVPPPDMESLRASFIVALEWFERVALARYQEGPYLLGAEISVLDIMAISAMERLAAGEEASVMTPCMSLTTTRCMLV